MRTAEEKKEYNRKNAREWGRKNRERKLAYMRDYQEKNREERVAYSKAYYEKNKETILADQKAKHAAKMAPIKAVKAIAMAERRAVAKEKAKITRRERYRNNVQYRVSALLRTRISIAIRAQGARKSAATARLVGCTIAELVAHLEAQFEPGMTWDNYGYRGWHVDHMRPIASFDLTDGEQQKACFHYTNLQPLWRLENQMKQRGCRTGEIHGEYALARALELT